MAMSPSRGGLVWGFWKPETDTPFLARFFLGAFLARNRVPMAAALAIVSFNRVGS